MALEGEEVSTTGWPVPSFSFRVVWNGAELTFQEVTGLEEETPIIEYRHGDSKLYSTAKMPGIKRFRNVTLKKGVVTSDLGFWKWFGGTLLDPVKRDPMTISLLDENGSVTMVWTLADAWPVKLSGTQLKSSGDEVTVETMEFMYDGLTVAEPQGGA